MICSYNSCFAEAKEGMKKCEKHLEMDRIKTRRWKNKVRAKWKEEGTCRYCGQPSMSKRIGICQFHADYMRNHGRKWQKKFRERNKEKGLCKCGKEKVPGKNLCPKCLERDRKYRAKMRPIFKDTGRCLNCGKPIEEIQLIYKKTPASLCINCSNKRNFRERTRTRIRK